ncbi:MAG: 4Fe-4S dicluster domain-containing protein [Nitrospiraceae bacterium]|nr:4Fe-4S dicluster domain-containing protein [Nitrospiraceae bacterium]
MAKYDIFVENRLCKGCNLCVSVCPKKVLELDPLTDKCKPMRPDDCIGCKMCENMCPDFAIAVEPAGGANPYANIKLKSEQED